MSIKQWIELHYYMYIQLHHMRFKCWILDIKRALGIIKD